MQPQQVAPFVIAFWGAQRNGLRQVRPRAQRLLLCRDSIGKEIGRNGCKIHLPRLQGIQRRAEKVLAVEGGGGGDHILIGRNHVHHAITAAGELQKPAGGRIVPIKFVGAGGVRYPFQVVLIAAHVGHLLDARRQDFPPLGRHLVNAVAAHRDGRCVQRISNPAEFRGLVAVRHARPGHHGAVLGR